MTNNKVVAIIATCNRSEKLRRIVHNIKNQTKAISQAIIIDSSEEVNSEYLNLEKNQDFKFKYIHTSIKSASKQRNIGIDYAFNDLKIEDEDLILFLDDDLIIPNDYCEKLAHGISLGFHGVSGLSDNPNFKVNLATRILDVYLFVFGIKTGSKGEVLKSGFANPVGRGKDEKFIEVSWLICCSMWQAKYLRNTRFDENLTGYSLGEDVILSTHLKYKKSAKLGVDRTLVFVNDTAATGTLNLREYEWKVSYMRNKTVENIGYTSNSVRFHLATIGLKLLRILRNIKISEVS
jgi:glycosyltransferase involved in cell wall biosynthesis